MSITLEELVTYVLSISKNNDNYDNTILNDTGENFLDKLYLKNINLYNVQCNESIYFSILGCLKNDIFTMSVDNKLILMDRFIEKIKKDTKKSQIKEKKILFRHILDSVISEYVICFMAEYFTLNIFVNYENKIILYSSTPYYDKFRNCIILNKINNSYNPLIKDNQYVFDSSSDCINKLIEYIDKVYILGIEGKLIYGIEDLCVYVKKQTTSDKIKNDEEDVIEEAKEIIIKTEDNKENHTSTEDDTLFIKISNKININGKTKLAELQKYAEKLGIPIMRNDSNKFKTRSQLFEEIKNHS